MTAVPHLADHAPVDEHDTPEIHTHSTETELRPCWGCWCYSCGGRTDRPRARRGDPREGLEDPDSHKWCYE